MNSQWIKKIDEDGLTPLSRASVSGRNELCTLLLQQEIEDSPRKACQLPPMHKAASLNYDDAIVDLIEEGRNVDEPDGQGQTALHRAARMGHAEAARTLLEHGATANREDLFGMTPLHWAALTGSKGVAEVLLQFNANVSAPDSYAGGITPLRIAESMGYTALVDLFENYFVRY
jgi:ankyrin repeat protein